MNNEMSLADRKLALNQTLDGLKNQANDDSSNFKFMNLLRSRLTEEGIPLEAATQIVANLNYDLSAVNEDDDYIGDVALAFAEFAILVYNRLKANNWHRNMTDTLVRNHFSITDIKL